MIKKLNKFRYIIITEGKIIDSLDALVVLDLDMLGGISSYLGWPDKCTCAALCECISVWIVSVIPQYTVE